QLVHHGVDRLFELEDFATDINGDFAREISIGNGRSNLGDIAHLAGQIAGHEIHVIGEVLPGSANAGHGSLSAQLPFGSDFAGHAGHFSSESVQLVDHGVDGVLQLKQLSLNIYGDLAGEISARDGSGNFGDVADLRRQIPGHRVD